MTRVEIHPATEATWSAIRESAAVAARIPRHFDTHSAVDADQVLQWLEGCGAAYDEDCFAPYGRREADVALAVVLGIIAVNRGLARWASVLWNESAVPAFVFPSGVAVLTDPAWVRMSLVVPPDDAEEADRSFYYYVGELACELLKEEARRNHQLATFASRCEYVDKRN